MTTRHEKPLWLGTRTGLFFRVSYGPMRGYTRQIVQFAREGLWEHALDVFKQMRRWADVQDNLCQVSG